MYESNIDSSCPLTPFKIPLYANLMFLLRESKVCWQVFSLGTSSQLRTSTSRANYFCTFIRKGSLDSLSTPESFSSELLVSICSGQLFCALETEWRCLAVSKFFTFWWMFSGLAVFLIIKVVLWEVCISCSSSPLAVTELGEGLRPTVWEECLTSLSL